jgi:hypothetical protein
MCRLYHLGRSPRELARHFCLTLDVPLPNFAPSRRIAMTDPASVLRRHPQNGEPRFDVLRWGLVPHWTKEPARALQAGQRALRDRQHVGDVPRRLSRAALPGAGRRMVQVAEISRRGKHALILSNASGKSSITKECVARTRDLQSGTSPIALGA